MLHISLPDIPDSAEDWHTTLVLFATVTRARVVRNREAPHIHITMSYMTGNTSLSCSCGRAFSQHSALSNHQRTCQTTGRRISGALVKFQRLFEGKKRRRLQDEGNFGENQQTVAPEIPESPEVYHGLII